MKYLFVLAVLILSATALADLKCTNENFARVAGFAYSYSGGSELNLDTFTLQSRFEPEGYEGAIFEMYSYEAKKEVKISLTVDPAKGCTFVAGFDLTNRRRLSVFTGTGH